MTEVKKLCRRGKITISREESVFSSLKLMGAEHLPGLVVCDNNKIQGVVRWHDLVTCHPNRLIMDAPIHQASPLLDSMDVDSALRIIRREKVHLHPVIAKDGQLNGIICFEDILRYILQKNPYYKAKPLWEETRTVLIMSKDPSNNHFVANTLQKWGYKTVTTNCDNVALKKIKSIFPSLILWDSKDTKHTLTVFKRIKTEPSTKSIPVLALLTKEMGDNRLEFLLSGADDYLMEPYHETELLLKIERLSEYRLLYNALKEKSEELKRHITSLRALQLLNESVIEQMGDGVLLLDTEGNVLKINRAGKEILKITHELEVLNKPITKLHRNLEAFLKPEAIFSPVKELEYSPDKTTSVFLEFKSTYLRGENGNKLGNITIFRDISRDKLLCQALQKERDLAQTILNTAQTIILLLDPEGQIVYFNPYLEQLSGYTLDEVKGKNWFDTFLDEEERPRIKALFKNAISGIPTKGNVNSIVGKNGSKYYIEWYDQTLKDAEGEITGLLAVGMNITERIKSEEIIRQEQAESFRLKNLLQNVVDNIMSGIVVTDMNGSIILMNKSGGEILGISPLESQNEPLDSFFPELKVFRTTLFSDDKNQCEVSISLPNNEKILLGFTSTYLHDDKDAKTGVITVFKDISDVKAMEKKLKERDRLATIGEIAGGIAHEIKNPIFAISSGIQVLKEELKLDKEQREIFDIIFKETLRVDKLIKQLLFYSRNQELQYSSFPVAQMISEVISLNKGLLKAKKIKLRQNIDKVRCYTRGDKDNLKQVLINILQNAIEVSRPGDVIEICCTCDKNKRVVKIEIKDKGPGIPVEYQDRVFDLFFSTKKGGAGMGLAISKKIIDQHEGLIYFRTKEDKGTTFVVELPFEEAGQ